MNYFLLCIFWGLSELVCDTGVVRMVRDKRLKYFIRKYQHNDI